MAASAGKAIPSSVGSLEYSPDTGETTIIVGDRTSLFPTNIRIGLSFRIQGLQQSIAQVQEVEGDFSPLPFRIGEMSIVATDVEITAAWYEVGRERVNLI